MEILFDGITIMFFGKSGVYTSIHVPPLSIAFLIFVAVGLYAHQSNKRREQKKYEPNNHPKGIAIIKLAVLLIAVSSIIFIPLNSLICDNAISCSWHPRADNPETWTISPDQIVNQAFEDAFAAP